MNRTIIIDIGHPANVHLFKHLYNDLTNRGWQCLFTLKNKEFTLNLLTAYHLKYKLLDNRVQSLMMRVGKTSIICFKFLMLTIKVKPQIVISRGSIHSTLVCRFKPSSVY
jgi:predicted glycosyltransferase